MEGLLLSDTLGPAGPKATFMKESKNRTRVRIATAALALVALLVTAPPMVTGRVDPDLGYGFTFLGGMLVVAGEPGILSASAGPDSLALFSMPQGAEILIDMGSSASRSGEGGEGRELVASVLDRAPPGVPFTFRISGFPADAGPLTLEVVAGNEVLRAAVEGERLVDIPEVPAIEGEAYQVRLTNPQGKTIALSLPLELVEGPNFASRCQPSGTSASETAFRSQVGRQTLIDTTAKPLTMGNLESEWTYRGGIGDDVVVTDAYSFGHGYQGANHFRMGTTNHAGFGHSWEGSRSTEQIYVNECRAWITVGHMFTVDRAVAFYRDVGGVIAVHERAWEKGRPSEDCDTALHPLLAEALGLSTYGGFISAGIPGTWCDENWKEIKTDPAGVTGLGVQMNRAAQNWYEGGEGFIQTHYSSTGSFNMELEGVADVRVFANACERCVAFNAAYRDGYVLTAPALVVP